ncbi:MAG: DUF222 domain-containing protein [Nitriliruptorales bacterium]|nr:DUF222 domain-containing protein [Nitriliruptorales bacterium]
MHRARTRRFVPGGPTRRGRARQGPPGPDRARRRGPRAVHRRRIGGGGSRGRCRGLSADSAGVTAHWSLRPTQRVSRRCLRRRIGLLRLNTTLGPGASKRRVNRAALLARMPVLRGAYERGEVRTEHVDAVLYRARPSRIDAIAEHDATLSQLAAAAEPRHLAVAVQGVVDHVDRDGADDPPPCVNEDLRGLSLRDGFGGMEELTGTTTALVGELLRRTWQVYDTPDPADIPEAQRRTPGQRFHDALQAALTVALDGAPATVGGVKVHAGVFVDLFTLLGADDLATIRPRFASGKGITPELARHLVATTTPTMRAIVGLGPWNPVSVGRVRTMPEWLKFASHLGHPHCRGPGCELPACLCDEDHIDPYCDGGLTATSNGAPMCHTHNVLKHDDNWTVTFDVETGEVTWTSADGRRVITLPPPDI